MNTLTVVLAVIGSVLGLLLIAAVYTIRKYLLQKRQQGESKDDPVFKFREFSASDSNVFEVPFTTRPIRKQIGAYPHEYNGHGSSEFIRLGAVKERHYRSSLPEYTSPEYVRTSMSSIGDKEEKLAESVPARIPGDRESITRFDRTQRKITSSMMNALAVQGKQASRAGRPSITEEMFLRDLESQVDYLYPENSIDDCSSSIHSLPEIVDSPSLDVGKRRLIERRHLNRSENAYIKKTYKKSGKIKFSTRYSEEGRMLELHVQKVFDLIPKRDAKHLNTFVRVYLVPGKRQRKDTQSVKGREPFFNEKVLFTDLEKDSLSKYRMKLKVYNKVRMKKYILGEVDIALSSIDTNAKETFTPDLFLQRSESSLASVSILLCHQATFSKLEVTIQSATNLPRVAGVSGQPNTYATVQLFKENSIDKKDSAIKKGTRNPEFNEMLDFDVETDSERPLSRFSLVVTLNHKPGVVGKDEVLGHVIFSVTSPQKSAAEHWKCVCDTPHRHYDLIHSLVDPDELLY